MSADVENKEEEIQEKKPSVYKRLIAYWQLGFKLVELLLCAVCLGFAYEPLRVTGLGKTHLHHVGVTYTAYTGSMLTLAIFVLARLLGDRIPYRTTSIFSASSCIMFLVTAVLLISDRAYLTKHNFFYPQQYLMEMLVTSTIFALVNAVVLAVDAMLTFRRKEDF